jgi:hypothetical protein
MPARRFSPSLASINETAIATWNSPHFSPAWSPNGKTIAYQDFMENADPLGLRVRIELFDLQNRDSEPLPQHWKMIRNMAAKPSVKVTEMNASWKTAGASAPRRFVSRVMTGPKI